MSVVWIATIAATFVVMEPLTYATHRWVMHGFGMAWHRSHHRRWVTGGRRADESWFERNDRFPVVFASGTMLVFAAGFNVAAAEPVLPVAIGVTLYGAAYTFVHDVYIHRRITRFTWRARWADRLADAHAIHHQLGGEPYGMLAPHVPADVRARADTATRPASAVGRV